jgi:tetratricopeptide (TPR) repeat protein
MLLMGLLGCAVRTNTPAEWGSEDAIWAAHLAAAGQNRDELEIVYPFDETVFPPEIAEPTFRWRDKNPKADTWLVAIEFTDGSGPLKALTRTMEWTPSQQQWRDVTTRSLESRAKMTILGVNRAAADKILSSGTIRISTSKDEVGAPLFFREVNLPFLTAVTDPAKYIRWRLGPISARQPPPIVLEKLPVCGNCHSFSRDGATLAMEVDSGNEKGGYAIAPVKEEIDLDLSKIIDWNDYKRDAEEPTFGLLCQISPDGRYVAGTVKDRALAVYRPDLMFSQLFFLIKGILAIYDRETKTIRALPGADDPEFVQTNPSWSPDGRYIVFARSRSKAYNPESLRKLRSVLVPQKEADAFLSGGKTFLYDLYRIPFNEGRGGKAEPVAGASNNGMSNYFAKYSPDGKWIVFCKAKSFMLLQPDSQLYIIPAAGGDARRLQCNTPRMNSWHSWSPNGKWLVFSSKLNGPYTQLFLTHMDGEGNSTPAVVLDRFTAPERAANIPEFVNMAPTAIRKIHEEFMDDHSHCRAGNQFAAAGDWENAERMFRRALKLNPRSVEAHTNLGQLLVRGNQREEGLQHLSAAVENDPDSVDAHVNLAGVLADAGRLEEAIAHCQRALRLKPDSADAHYTLAYALDGRGQVDEAIAHYRKATELKPDSAEAHNALAIALAGRGRVDEAITYFQKALELKPDFAEAHNNLGVALADRGRVDEAIVHYQKALQIKPDFVDARRNLEALRSKR